MLFLITEIIQATAKLARGDDDVDDNNKQQCLYFKLSFLSNEQNA